MEQWTGGSDEWKWWLLGVAMVAVVILFAIVFLGDLQWALGAAK